MRLFSCLAAVMMVGCEPNQAPQAADCRGKLAMTVERLLPDGDLVEAAHIRYSVHVADKKHPRRLGRLIETGQADAHGFVTVASVACGDYVLALSGVNETSAFLVLPFEDKEPQAWIVQE